MLASLDLEGLSAVLDTDEIQRFGDITLGIIKTDVWGRHRTHLGVSGGETYLVLRVD